MNIVQFQQQLQAITTTPSQQAEKLAKICLDRYLQRFGFKYYAFTYYAGHTKTGRKLRYEFASEALKPWHDYYLEQCYADVDRTLEEIYTNNLPIFWDVETQLTSSKNNRETRIRLESLEFGIRKGLSVPVHGPNHDFATLTLHQCHGEHSLQHYLLHQFEWMSATQIFYHYTKKILFIAENFSETYKLTRREKQCLDLTAQLWRVEKIAKELNISPRTVNFHLQNANRKLGTHSKYQSAFKYYPCNW